MPPAPEPSATRDPDAVAALPLTIREVSLDRLDLIERLNVAVFDDDHIINTFDHDDLLMLVAWSEETAVGFKLGYQHDEQSFYSAKGGVRAAYRRQGIARALLYAMLNVVEARGYERFLYDTFPNKHPGMTVMGLDEGFRVIRAGYSPRYQDYRLRFELTLSASQ
jgi:ribosomal protein S18 acetylase RimI-like enzyme